MEEQKEKYLKDYLEKYEELKNKNNCNLNYLSHNFNDKKVFE